MRLSLGTPLFAASLALAFAASLGLALPAVAAPTAPPPPAQARPIEVGSRLVAVREVALRQATIAKGSRVRVTDIARRQGRPIALDLELPDGHVLDRIAYAKVKASFRLAR